MGMLFKDFADYLERLEKTSSRLAITEVLAELIGKMELDEVDKGVYLTLGMLGPDFDNKEFNMAVKMVIRSVADSSGLTIGEVDYIYKTKGDLGLLVEDLAFKGDRLVKYSVGEVYNKLRIMADESGGGSQERKVARLTELFLSTSRLERKFIARMVLGKLRLGFTEKTIFDALSQINSGGKTLRKKLDSVFQIYPDAGFVTKVVKEKGMDGLRYIKVKTGVPVVPALCQRLNNYQEIIDKMGDVAVEQKYDGTRVQIHFNRSKNEIKTYTRNLEESSPMFPELFKMKDWIDAEEVILDCEAVGYDVKTQKILPFQLTITRKRKHSVVEAAKTVPLRFFAFDILSLNGASLIERPYFERRETLKKVIKDNLIVVADEYKKSNDPKVLQTLHDQFLKDGLEGAVIKKWNGEYLPGRQGWNWVKIKEAEGTTGKLSDTFDLVILGYYYGKGKRVGFGIGAFLVGLIKDSIWVSIAKIGTGLSDDEFRALRKKLEEIKSDQKPKNYQVSGSLVPDVWVEPKIVVEVAADELTRSPNHAGGLALRFPRLIKFRDDKGIKDATTWKEVEEISKLSKV